MHTRIFVLITFVLTFVWMPSIGRAALSDPFVYDTRLIGMSTISGAPYGTFQTAVRIGNTPTLQTSVYTQGTTPFVSVDLSQFGFSNSTTTDGIWRGYGAPHYPSYFYNFGPITITSDIHDGTYIVPITAVGNYGVATATMSIIVDNAPPTVLLSSITFSTTSPRGGDYMYLSGKLDGTGSIAKASQITMRLSDSAGNPVVSTILGGSTFGFDPSGLNTTLANSVDGSFSHVPIQLIDFGDTEWIPRATNLNIDITAYDEAGNISSGNLTVLVPKPTPPDPCVIPGACASNVLFLPGIEASRLYRPDYSDGTDQLWEPNTDSDTQDLYLNSDGTSVRDDVYTKDVIDEKNVLPFGQGNIYKSFLNDLSSWKNTEHFISDYGVAPYDWRLSFDDILNNGHQFPDGRIYYSGNLAATSSPYILQELRRLAKSSKTGKVTIVAHSNGGLLTKALTEKLGSEASTLIDKIIFVAVPQVGTPQAVGALLHGYDQGLPFDFAPLVLTPETARTLAENMPSVYNLLPSADYLTYVDNPVVTFDNSDFLAEFRARYGSTIHDGVQLKNFIIDTWRLASSLPSDLKYPSVGNATLLSRAETLHTILDAWTPPQGVSLYEVAGWGEDTLATIAYREGKKASCSSLLDIRSCTVKSAITYDPIEVVEGDGTVLVPSALWTPVSNTSAKYWVNLREYDSRIRLERKHADILEVPELRTLIQNILTNSTSTTPLTFISTAQPAANASDERLRFVLHSPLNLSATDGLGNVVNSTISTIPGSRFKRYGEVKVLTVPKNTPLTLNLDGYAPGSFTLDMQEIDGDNTVVASSTFSAIPSTTNTTASITFSDGTLQNASPLQLDYDGNGAADFLLESKLGEEVVFDITPPEATITFDPVLQKINVIGTDNLSSTTVSTTATSTIITDESGNILQIVFKKLRQEKKELKLEIQELRYNGISSGNASKTVLQYEWSTDKTGKLKELEEKATAGTLKIEGHYDAKKNVTRIEEKVKDREDKDEKERENKKTLPGLVIISLSTDKGKVGVNY